GPAGSSRVTPSRSCTARTRGPGAVPSSARTAPARRPRPWRKPARVQAGSAARGSCCYLAVGLLPPSGGGPNRKRGVIFGPCGKPPAPSVQVPGSLRPSCHGLLDVTLRPRHDLGGRLRGPVEGMSVLVVLRDEGE